MSQKPFKPGKDLPPWVLIAGSVAIALHLGVVAVRSLGARSGPWPFGEQNSPAEPPVFANKIDDYTNRYYLRPLHMSHDYHFEANHPEVEDAYFEVELKSKNGQVKKLRFPED